MKYSEGTISILQQLKAQIPEDFQNTFTHYFDAVEAGHKLEDVPLGPWIKINFIAGFNSIPSNVMFGAAFISWYIAAYSEAAQAVAVSSADVKATSQAVTRVNLPIPQPVSAPVVSAVAPAAPGQPVVAPKQGAGTPTKPNLPPRWRAGTKRLAAKARMYTKADPATSCDSRLNGGWQAVGLNKNAK